MGCNDAARILRILPVFREADGACRILNADKHSPASSARSDCVHEQVAKLGPVSRAAGMDCECPLYVPDASIENRQKVCLTVMK